MARPIKLNRADVLEWAVAAARAADEKKASDVVVLEVGNVLAITDFFVIASASNTRQVRTLADEVERSLKLLDPNLGPLRVEGLRDLTWVLLDYGAIVVHLFLDETRTFYDIERLYRDVPRLPWQAPVAAELA